MVRGAPCTSRSGDVSPASHTQPMALTQRKGLNERTYLPRCASRLDGASKCPLEGRRSADESGVTSYSGMPRLCPRTVHDGNRLPHHRYELLCLILSGVLHVPLGCHSCTAATAPQSEASPSRDAGGFAKVPSGCRRHGSARSMWMSSAVASPVKTVHLYTKSHGRLFCRAPRVAATHPEGRESPRRPR